MRTDRMGATPAVSRLEGGAIAATGGVGSSIPCEGRSVASRVALPPPASVDMVEELTALWSELSHLSIESDLRDKIRTSIQKARREVVLPSRNREVVGECLNCALKTARRSDDFPLMVDRIRPNVVRVTSWLGKSWYRILGVVGLSA